ncbi:MAG: aldehyde dehydrogenase family protein [Planctomycetota bacterium]|jgi:aldehyde dehydrogenase (NAD+)|nr:MAG: aldehyde dehydrogenase family protein [Planctomycetota bacterium]
MRSVSLRTRDGIRRSKIELVNQTPFAYAPAPESVRPVLKPAYGLFIGGKFVEPRSGKSFKTINPATEESIAMVADAGAEDVARAVAAARKALPAWSKTKPAERAKLLFRVARRIQERSRELAVLESMNGGKPIRESRDEDLPLVAQHFFHHAGWCDKLMYAFAGATAHPIGVCGQIIPWNFPLMMAAWKLAPALACGNTCVLKPAETTPLTALMLGEILQECGLPDGVVNIVTGGPDAGRAITALAGRGVDKIAFTGSTEVGKAIAKSVAGTGTKLTLELGGKSPNIVFADAALDQAVEGVVSGIWFNQGHVCCAGSRLFLEESIHDDFIERLKARMKMLRVGDPLDKNTDVGAINSKSQLEVINRFVSAGSAEGAQKFEVSCDLPKKGFWCRPALFTGVQPSHTIAREEIFGPVLSVMTFRTPEEAVQRANNTTYGLSAGVWTEKAARALEMSNRLSAGVVWLNTFNRFDATAPFGGYRESGFGREGGRQGLMSYVKLANAKKKTGGKR